MQHLHRNGQMKADALPLFAVTLRFANPNADFTVTLPARSKANALWVAAEWRDRHPEGIRDGQIGEIRRAAR